MKFKIPKKVAPLLFRQANLPDHTDDGYVPLHYKAYDGNKADVTTHIGVWEELRSLLNKEDCCMARRGRSGYARIP